MDGNVRIRNINNNIGAKGDRVVVADSNGELKTVKATMPSVFYMPAVLFDTSTLAVNQKQYSCKKLQYPDL